MSDPTEELRRQQVAELNRDGIPDNYDGPIWDTAQMQAEFSVDGFMAPYVVVRRKSDGVRGTLTFTHSPRWYFDFTEVS